MNAWHQVNPSTLNPGDYVRATRTSADGLPRVKVGTVTNTHHRRVTIDLDAFRDGSDTYLDEGWDWEVCRDEAPVTIGVARDNDGAPVGIDWAGITQAGWAARYMGPGTDAA